MFILVGSFAKGVVGPRDGAVEPAAIRVSGGHVGGIRAVVGEVPLMGAAVHAATPGSVALVLEAGDSGFDVGGVGSVDVAGVGL